MKLEHREQAKKLRANALKWVASGHKHFADDMAMVACYTRDYRDLMYIAMLIEQQADKDIIYDSIRNLDTIVRDQIPTKLYNHYIEN